ncbi:MAG: DUF2061 domain-containing protein [Nanoarchaeota archaeon]|nr:DUF2061 domain-containing protein [Nanoarchaeota archaeon]
MEEKHTRSIVKTISWRIIATATTIALVFMFTGSHELSLTVGALEVISKLIFYYAHERVWSKVNWGVQKAVPEES